MNEARADWQDAFRSCMTRVSFELKLTRAMLELLCATAEDVRWDRRAFGSILYPDNWIATEQALRRRGLLVRLPPSAIKEDRVPIPWKLTPAGEAVIQMLKVGGLYLEPHEALKKLAGRKGRL